MNDFTRLVGTVKSSLQKALFQRKVSLPELQAMLGKIEVRENGRPLTYQTEY